jgi:NADH-quinone oxidoreductase subunit J
MPHPLFLDEASPSRWDALGPFLHEYWHVLLPSLLGFIAVYALLPRVRHAPRLWAVGVAVLALVLGAAFLIHAEAVFAETVLFYGFAGVAVLGGALLVTQSNPVYAALSFALVVLSTCGLFLLQAAPFLMAATIIIYAGAIVVTFLFVIMLAQQAGISNADLRSREPFLSCLAGFILLASLLCVLHRTYEPTELNDLARQLTQLSRAKSQEEVAFILGTPELKQLTSPLTNSLRKYLPDTLDNERNYASKIDTLRTEVGRDPKYLEPLRNTAAQALAAVEEVRRDYGSLSRGTVPGKLTTPGRLPAENVAALGQTLFTDYLVPVELAAVLLLVATIGAILIAHRRSEDLR